MIRLDEKDASMDYAPRPRWIYDSSAEDAYGLPDEVREFAADLVVGVLVLLAIVGAATIGRLFFGAVTP